MNGFGKLAISLLPFAVVAVWWLWWKLPKRETEKLRHRIRDPKDRVEVEDTFRKTIGQALGGIVVLIGAGVGFAQFLDQRETAQKQLTVSQQQIGASHDLLVSNQIAKGFEQLGSDKIEVRLGGIYALEGILHMEHSDNTSSPDYRQPVLEALCAFVREHTIGMIVQEQPTTDVQAVLTVIGRRRLEDVPADGTEGPGWETSQLGQVDLSNAKLPGGNLSNAPLNSARLPGADLRRANLYGAHLDRANLDSTHLETANLVYAHLSRTYLGDAHLDHANLYGAHLDPALLRRANLSDAHLTFADLSGADLIGATLTDTDLTGATLANTDLTGVKNLTQKQLDRACGKPKDLPPGLVLDKPCPPKPPAASPLN